MAEASDSFPIANDLSIDSNTSFWVDLYASNQDDNTSSSSRRDHEWGWVFDKTTSQTKKKKKKKRSDVGSSSAANSASDLSEALSAISAHLSLSSSSQSSRTSDEEPVWMDSNMGAQSFENNNEDGTQDLWTLEGIKEIQKDNVRVPELGITFWSEEEVYKSYKNYAKKTGFRVRKGKVQRLSNGSIRKRYFFCSKQGFRSKKQFNKITKYKRKETRTGCNAKIQCTVENGKWIISEFLQEHNHELKDQTHMIVQNPKTSDAVLSGGAVEPLTPKTLNLINKSAAFEKSQRMAEIYLDMALKWVEDVLKSESTVLKLTSSNGMERELDKNPSNSESHHEEHSLDKQAVKAMAETANDGTPGTWNSSSNSITSDIDKNYEIEEALRVQRELLQRLHLDVEAYKKGIEASRIALRRISEAILVAYKKSNSASSTSLKTKL